MYLHRMRASLDEGGKPAALDGVIVGQSILAGTAFAGMIQNGIDMSSVEGLADSPYVTAIADHHISLHSPQTGIPVLWWRAVGHTHTAFAAECFVDELAHAAKQDPLAYRKVLLTKAGAKRHLAVLERVAAEFGWDAELAEGHGKGIAVHESFASYVAQIAEVSVDKGKVRVHRLVCAIDCGIFVNPMTIQAQVEGGLVFGLSAALNMRLDIKDGRVVQSNFHDYTPMRIGEMPKVSVHIVDSGEKPGGVGEPGTPPIAPAVANALFDATGQRLRSLPFRLR